MPPANALEGLAKRLAAAPKVIEAEVSVAVAKGTAILAASVRRKLPASGRLRGVGKGGAPVGVAFDTRPGKRSTGLVRATGPLQLLERDTRAHDIVAHGKPLATPYGPRARVHHPGTHGQHLFEKGIADGLPLAREIVEGAFKKLPGLLR